MGHSTLFKDHFLEQKASEFLAAGGRDLCDDHLLPQHCAELTRLADAFAQELLGRFEELPLGERVTDRPMGDVTGVGDHIFLALVGDCPELADPVRLGAAENDPVYRDQALAVEISRIITASVVEAFKGAGYEDNVAGR